MLDHLLKDVKKRENEIWRDPPRRNDRGKAKVINMIRNLSNDRKRRYEEPEEEWMNVPIVFHPVRTYDLSEEALIVEGNIAGYFVRRIYVDEGSSVNVMYKHYFRNLSSSIKFGLHKTSTSLVGFSGKTSKPLGIN